MQRQKPGPGQESVWDYPRPPRLESSTRKIRVIFAGQVIAESSRAYRLLETSHPPSWYIPRSDVKMEFLTRANRNSFCEWKGVANYWSVSVGGDVNEGAAWSYESPNKTFAELTGCLAFFPGRFECYVDDDRAKPQAGGFYGGWITRDVAGPFKGIPGSSGW